MEQEALVKANAARVAKETAASKAAAKRAEDQADADRVANSRAIRLSLDQRGIYAPSPPQREPKEIVFGEGRKTGYDPIPNGRRWDWWTVPREYTIKTGKTGRR